MDFIKKESFKIYGKSSVDVERKRGAGGVL